MSIKLEVAPPLDEAHREHIEQEFDTEGLAPPLGRAGLPSLDPPHVDEHVAEGTMWSGDPALSPAPAAEPQPVPLSVLPTVPVAEEAPVPVPAKPVQALAKQELSSTVITKQGGINSEDPLVLQQWGMVVVESNMFPNIHTWQAAVACGKMCQDLRLAPWISMGQFHIIEGKPTLSLPLILQLVKRAGVKYQFTQDYGYFAHPVSQAGDFLTEITFEHPSLMGGQVSYQIWFSECVQAGWTTKQNWRNMPRTMLRARVITTACRLYFPDLLGGSYEFSEMVDAGKVEDHTYAMEI